MFGNYNDYFVEVIKDGNVIHSEHVRAKDMSSKDVGEAVLEECRKLQPTGYKVFSLDYSVSKI